MKIKDMIESCAVYLGRQEIIDYFNNCYEYDTTEIESNVNTMIKLSNLVISELSLGYIDLITTEEVVASSGKINYLDLSKTAVKILDVLDYNGNSISFKVKEDHVETSTNARKVKYKYLPPEYQLNDEIGYSENDLSLSTLSYGLCAEFCIVQCRFDEALMWRNRYIQEINKLIKPKNCTIKGRIWI